MNNRELFSAKSEDYSKFRPSYPEAAVEWLKSRTGGESVLDVGAGTGIFTQLLTCFFKKVSAIEPNNDMRKKFTEFLPEIYCAGTTGEATGLPDDSFDLITVAQAFHWLDAEQFKLEAMRLLHPDGKIAIIWNSTLPCDFNIERNDVCRKYCPRFRSGHAGKHSPAEGDAFLRYNYFREVEVISFANPFAMDILTFEGNMRSRSYALTPEDADYEFFMTELRDVFERHAINGIVNEMQETQIYFGCF
ncbi:MAG: methyltransferase domain-containing protein [Lentisphaeria bacterium]|nr:methyltransferase domain-containing protein [Lentisphaeria bacterium]